MVRVQVEGVFLASLDRVWRLLHRHRDDVTAIHPDILSQKVVREEGEVDYQGLTFSKRIVLDREWRLGGRPWTSTWQYTQTPPERFRVELIGGDEPFTVGSYWESTYREVPLGTLIVTQGDIRFQDLKVPRFLQGWAVRRGMSRSDKEDLEYLSTANP